jgi:hypothetical protein
MIERVNLRLKKVGRLSWWLVAVGLVAGVLFNLAQSRSGVYTYHARAGWQPTLASKYTPTSMGDAIAIAHEHWWASLRPFHLASLGWIAIGGFGTYLALSQLIAGWIYIRLVFDLSTCMVIGFNPLDADGAYGWQPIRNILTLLWIATVAFAIDLAAISYLLGPLLPPVVWVTLSSFFLFNNGLILVAGWTLFRRHASAFRSYILQGALSGDVTRWSLFGPPWSDSADAYRAALANYQWPRLPQSLVRPVIGGVVYLAALGGSIASIYAVLV